MTTGDVIALVFIVGLPVAGATLDCVGMSSPWSNKPFGPFEAIDVAEYLAAGIAAAPRKRLRIRRETGIYYYERGHRVLTDGKAMVAQKRRWWLLGLWKESQRWDDWRAAVRMQAAIEHRLQFEPHE